MSEHLVNLCAALLAAAALALGAHVAAADESWEVHTPIDQVSITNPSSGNNVVAVNTQVAFTCSACDDYDKKWENGDPEIVEDTVNYKWWCSGGGFAGTDEGMSVTWVAPAAGGSYTVRVTASDTDSRAPRGDGSDDDEDKIAEMTMYVVKVDIKQGGNIITGQTQNTIVGRHISLEGAVAAGGLEVTNHSWTVPGKAVAGYTATEGLGEVDQLDDELGNATITFYWVDAGDGREVKYTATVGGKQFPATTTFNVKRPIASITATTGAVSVDNDNDWLVFDGPGGVGVNGIYFERVLIEPEGFEPGSTVWVQVVDYLLVRRRFLEAWERKSMAGRIDSEYPYSSNAATADSPLVTLSPAFNLYTREDDFSMYLMYRRPWMETPIIDVPLRKVQWSWSGQASRVGGGPDFQLDTSSHSANPGDADCTDHPEWWLSSDNPEPEWQSE